MKLSSSARLRYVVVGAAVVTLVLVQLFAVLMSGISARENSVLVGREAISRVGDTTIQSILRHLEPAEQSVGVTGRLVHDDLIDVSGESLERYLYTQLAVMPQMTGAFVGYPDGAFVFVSREGDGFRSKRIDVDPSRTVLVGHFDASFQLLSTEQPTDDTYDPRTRPWYGLASSSEDVEWTDPYVFFSSGQPGVTAARAVHEGDEVTAVVGVDVELSGLSDFLDDLPVGQSGEAFVVSGSTVVAAPASYGDQTSVEPDGSLRLLTVDELGVVAGDGSASSLTVIDQGDGDQLVLHRDFPTDQGLEWSVVVRAPESDFTAALVEQQRATIFILIGGGILLVAGLMVLWRVTRPLQALHQMASTDSLTGLANRRSVTDAGAGLVAGAARSGQRMSALVIDLDGFKALNDQLGHHAGDEALRQVAGYLTDAASPRDVIGRLGGDEFVVISAVDDVGGAVRRSDELLAGLIEILRPLGQPAGSVGASAGLSVAPATEVDVDVLLREADSALISAKTGGKGTVRLSNRLETV